MAPSLARNRGHRARRRTFLPLLFLLLMPAPSLAQQPSGFADALFALQRTQADNVTRINARLYGGRIESQIFQGDGNNDTFTDRDSITFLLSSTRGAGRSVSCTGGRSAFEDCIRRNVSDVLAILFPASLSASVSGRDTAQYEAQQSVLASALGTATASEGGRLRRSEIGGLIEHEWFTDGDVDSGRAWQGFYRIAGGPVSVRGRYAELRQEGLTTRSIQASFGVHPSFEISRAAQWRAGVDLRSGLLLSRSAALDLGCFDVGGGFWTAAARDFSRVRLGAGATFQGSRGYMPAALVGDSLEFLASAYNDTGITYDAAYGGIVGVIVSPRASLNAKVLETRAVAGTGFRPPSRVALVGLSYLVGGHTPLDVGYKLSTGAGLTAHGLFVQGNYRW